MATPALDVSQRDIRMTAWENVLVNIPYEIPPIKNSDGMDQIGTFRQITPKSLQYLNTSRRPFHEIPPAVHEQYCLMGRPTPLMRARNLEQYLDTPAHIYLKREDVNPVGSFKINTALAQAHQAKLEGYEGVVTETGAGQWGLAISVACAIYKLKCRVFMARCSYGQKPMRRQLMEFYGAEVAPSPSSFTAAGRSLAENPDFYNGSIGTAISEAVEFAQSHPGYAYVAGSNLPFVYIHQSIIGLEAVRQLYNAGEQPDTVIACVGGGSIFSGFALPFRYSNTRFDTSPELLACESTVIPRLTKGEYRYDHADPMGITPMGLSYTLGKDFTPPPTHIGGLRQHNGSPVVGVLLKNKEVTARAYDEAEIFAAGRLLALQEGIMSSPESCHSIAGVISAALKAKEESRQQVIVSCVSGSGVLDLPGFLKHINL